MKYNKDNVIYIDFILKEKKSTQKLFYFSIRTLLKGIYYITNYNKTF